MALADIEIKATMNEYRPCTVFYEGKEYKALFHQWEVKEQLLIKFKTAQRWSEMEMKATAIRECLICQTPNEQVTKVRTLMALVEFEDGSVKEVEPTSVKFLDSKERFEDYNWERTDVTEVQDRNCDNCKHAKKSDKDEPCNTCIAVSAGKGRHSKWEAK